MWEFRDNEDSKPLATHRPTAISFITIPPSTSQSTACSWRLTAIKPYLIFTSKNPETNWFPPNEQLPDFIYAFSKKGWSNDELAVDWLWRIFLQ
jgi:DDE superfamily endonuclease